MTRAEIEERLKLLADERTAAVSQRFFKTGAGQYGEGDLFLGIRVPVLRKLAGEYQAVDLDETVRLLHSPFHEARLLALLILVRAYARGDEAARTRIYRLYLENTRFINNWDLVDSSAPYIIGPYLSRRSKRPLYALAQSSHLWERRIGMLAAFHFIKQGEFTEALKLAALLLDDREDLIHKAVGWMLREVGKRHLPSEENFLRRHYRKMPRTMLRYAIEKFPADRRNLYLSGRV